VIKAHAGTVRAVDFSPDGRLLLTAGDDKAVKARAQSAAGVGVLDNCLTLSSLPLC